MKITVSQYRKLIQALTWYFLNINKLLKDFACLFFHNLILVYMKANV